MRPRLDLPAWLFGSIAVGALFGLPFVISKANRIVPGVPVGLVDCDLVAVCVGERVWLAVRVSV